LETKALQSKITNCFRSSNRTYAQDQRNRVSGRWFCEWNLDFSFSNPVSG